uniref:Uncharacterized protein n=1 Tax=Candidatus Kentrum sp. LPFa TaxID=2126335 RepID=A0A450XG04_9GAMM|nr:MAG: hypothetical protein BECKLPF1236A_GA0070988_100668 [Candidatus Kentron sp. LPFa]VFK28179.1 MAG: hypothetical protein BECKLPF1236C_GA0070990_1006014 [Candidatus Kentron sp. LPFa]
MISDVIGINVDIPEDRDQAISQLKRISRRMRAISMLMISMTMINIALTLGAIYGISISGLYKLELSLIVGAIIIFTAFAVLATFRFDFFKREGDAYFEELSDELHAVKISEPDDKSSFGARIVMRNYSNYSSLPLIPGRFGPGIIAGVNLLQPLLILPFLTTVVA